MTSSQFRFDQNPTYQLAGFRRVDVATRMFAANAPKQCSERHLSSSQDKVEHSLYIMPFIMSDNHLSNSKHTYNMTLYVIQINSKLETSQCGNHFDFLTDKESCLMSQKPEQSVNINIVILHDTQTVPIKTQDAYRSINIKSSAHVDFY